MTGIFEVVNIIKELSPEIQIFAKYRDLDGSIFKSRCFFIGKINEIDFHDGKEFVLNTFTAPVELSEEFQYGGEVSNFLGFEVSHSNKKPKEKKNLTQLKGGDLKNG